MELYVTSCRCSAHCWQAQFSVYIAFILFGSWFRFYFAVFVWSRSSGSWLERKGNSMAVVHAKSSDIKWRFWPLFVANIIMMHHPLGCFRLENTKIKLLDACSIRHGLDGKSVENKQRRIRPACTEIDESTALLFEARCLFSSDFSVDLLMTSIYILM